jgi:g-D-glutamyl-meso-diaminopimelate peptidase
MFSSLSGRNSGPSCRLARIRVAALAIVLCMAILLFQQGRADASALPPYASVAVSKLTIRQSTSNSSKAVSTVYKGDVVKVLSSKSTWYKVSTSAGLAGWCQVKYLAFSNAASFKPSGTAVLDWPSDYVSTSQTLTYPRCVQAMNSIALKYSANARIETIGTSVMGNPINAIVLGSPDAGARILVQAEIHAREYISSLLALRQAETLLKAASLNASYNKINISSLLQNVEIWIVPMSNPDGARLVTEGLGAVPASMPELKASLRAMNNGSGDFTRWKANANGVDLNRNFDAGWRLDSKYPKPGRENYGGTQPFSEPESIALRDLTVTKDFALTLSYHSSGQMIYWYDPNGENDLNLYMAGEIKALSGYRVLSVSSQGFDGGFRDWYVNQYHRPGMTVEVGSGYCPLPLSSFAGIWQRDRFIMLKMAWIVDPKGLSDYIG